MAKEYADYKASGLTQKQYLGKRGYYPGMSAEESLAYLDCCRKQYRKSGK